MRSTARMVTVVWGRRTRRSRARKVGFGLFGVLAAVLLSATPAVAQELTPGSTTFRTV